MPREFDAASKYILDMYPADWLALAGLPVGESIQSVDSDLSVVSRAADKLMLVKAF